MGKNPPSDGRTIKMGKEEEELPNFDAEREREKKPEEWRWWKGNKNTNMNRSI